VSLIHPPPNRVKTKEHLAYARVQELILVTFDRPFAGRTQKHSDHGGLICLTLPQDDIGGIVRALTEFSEIYTAEDAAGQVFWL
jgi:hypothetical protein